MTIQNSEKSVLSPIDQAILTIEMLIGCIMYKDNPKEITHAKGVLELLKSPSIGTRIVKAISLIHATGRDCVAIYLGDKYRWELEKISNGQSIRKFYDLPVYFVVEPNDHFFIASGWKEPNR